MDTVQRSAMAAFGRGGEHAALMSGCGAAFPGWAPGAGGGPQEGVAGAAGPLYPLSVRVQVKPVLQDASHKTYKQTRDEGSWRERDWWGVGSIKVSFPVPRLPGHMCPGLHSEGSLSLPEVSLSLSNSHYEGKPPHFDLSIHNNGSSGSHTCTAIIAAIHSEVTFTNQ